MFFCLSGEVQTGVCVVESSSVSCLYCYVILFIRRGADWSMRSWIFISQLFILCSCVYQERYRPEYVWLNLHQSAVYIVMFFCLSGEVQTGVCVDESSSVSCLYCYVLLFIRRGTDRSMCRWIFICQLFILLCSCVYQERYRPEYVWLNLHQSAVYIMFLCLSGEVQTGVCVVESSSVSCLYCYVILFIRRGTDRSMCSWIFISQLFILLCYSVYQERYRLEYVWLNLHLSAVYIVILFFLSGEVFYSFYQERYRPEYV